MRLATLEPGTHLCAFHRDAAQRTRIASTFIAQGLAAGDQTLYVTTEERADSVLRSLPGGVAAEESLSSGQLRIVTLADAYGASRPEDLETVADGFRAAAADATKSGFPGLRVAAEMDGIADLLGSTDALLAWELMSTELQREIGVSSVCMYDALGLEADQITRLTAAHAGLAPELDEIPPARFLAVHEPWGLRVSGEVDLYNRHLLHRALLSRVAVSRDVRVDLGGLTFVDGAGVALLRSAAAALPDGGSLTLSRVPAVVRRILDISGIRHERLRMEP